LPQNRGMTALIGISGSLRQASFNTALLRAVATQLPASVSALKERVVGAAGFVDAVRRSQR
jgi:NAD(P)H-dependent FMN reductase